MLCTTYFANLSTQAFDITLVSICGKAPEGCELLRGT